MQPLGKLEELLAAARVPVFLLDEHQVVKPGELGNVDIITAYAKRLNLAVDVVSLHGQFPCGGSEAYEQWVLDLLGLGDGKPAAWTGDGRFDLRVAESPEELESFLAGKQLVGETALMTAGYCWPWSDPRPDLHRSWPATVALHDEAVTSSPHRWAPNSGTTHQDWISTDSADPERPHVEGRFPEGGDMQLYLDYGQTRSGCVREFRRHVAGTACRTVCANRHHW